MVYPEAVSLAAIIASPLWRRLAAGTPDERQLFNIQIAQRITYPYLDDPDRGDAVKHRALADAWRPQAQPLHIHTPGRMKGLLSPVHAASITRHDKSSLWFARTRQAGSTLLHHGHVKAALLRPWRPDYEQIRGTIWHSIRTDSKMQDLIARERAAEVNT